MENQLNLAEAKVQSSIVATAKLIHWWRTHLFRLGLLVAGLTLYQLQQIVSECRKNHTVRKRRKTRERESLCVRSIVLCVYSFRHCIQFIRLVQVEWDDAMAVLGLVSWMVRDSLAELLGMVIVVCMSVFLHDGQSKAGKFANSWYLLASVCVPLVVYFYFERDTIGCLVVPTQDEEEDSLTTAAAAAKGAERTFPVALVFHAMVTTSNWYMGLLSDARQNDMKSIQRLREDLQRASTITNTTNNNNNNNNKTSTTNKKTE